jgi:hypothetical protein
MLFEFRLLLACARAHPTPDYEAEIRAMLIDRIDWTRFARTAVECGLASLAGRALIGGSGCSAASRRRAFRFKMPSSSTTRGALQYKSPST